MYLNHFLVIVAYGTFFGLFPDFMGPVAGTMIPSFLVYCLIVLATTLGIGWVIWHVYEKHWLHLKKYARYQWKQPADRPGKSLVPASEPGKESGRARTDALHLLCNAPRRTESAAEPWLG